MLKPEFETIGSLSTSCLKYMFLLWTHTHTTHSSTKEKSYQNSYSFIFILNSAINTLRLHFNSFLAHIFQYKTTYTQLLIHSRSLTPFRYRFWSTLEMERRAHTTPHRHHQIEMKIARKKPFFFCFKFFSINFTAWPVIACRKVAAKKS